MFSSTKETRPAEAGRVKGAESVPSLAGEGGAGGHEQGGHAHGCAAAGLLGGSVGGRLGSLLGGGLGSHRSVGSRIPRLVYIVAQRGAACQGGCLNLAIFP